MTFYEYKTLKRGTLKWHRGTWQFHLINYMNSTNVILVNSRATDMNSSLDQLWTNELLQIAPQRAFMVFHPFLLVVMSINMLSKKKNIGILFRSSIGRNFLKKNKKKKTCFLIPGWFCCQYICLHDMSSCWSTSQNPVDLLLWIMFYPHTILHFCELYSSYTYDFYRFLSEMYMWEEGLLIICYHHNRSKRREDKEEEDE